MKMIVAPRAIRVQIFASMLLLSSCGGGNSAEENPLEDDCTPTITTSTSLELQVGINGNISLVPVADNSISGCGSSTEPDGTIELTESITTRFKSSEDFDVWECDTENGAKVYYALLEKLNTSYQHFGLEIGPVDSPLPVSQPIFWKASNADKLLASVPEQDIEIEWTNIEFSRVDTMSANSTTRGALQCTLKTIDDNGESLFGFDVVLTSLAAGSDGTVELTSRIQTDFESPLNQDLWNCWAEDGSLFSYTFFDRDYPYAPNQSYPYDPNSGKTYGLEYSSGIDYFWRATSADSLLQEHNGQDTQIEWTDIRFTGSDHLTANSTSEGALNCFLVNLGNRTKK